MLLILPLLLAADTDPEAWGTRTENAAVRFRAAAEQLASTAGTIAASGRVQQLAVLRADSDDLVRRAKQLSLWADQASEPTR